MNESLGAMGLTNPRDPARLSDRFPSLADLGKVAVFRYELQQLRGSESELNGKADLLCERAKKWPDEEPAGRLVRDIPARIEGCHTAIDDLIAGLNLSPSRHAALSRDAFLIAIRAWEPDIDIGLQFEEARYRKALPATVKLARSLHDTLLPHVLDLDSAFIETVSDDDAEFDVTDLMTNLQRYVVRAERVAETLAGSAGRSSEFHRNAIMALLTVAVESATDAPVKVSNGTAKKNGKHFSSPSGQFVADLMSYLGWRQEATLVGAFKRIRTRKNPARIQPD